MKLIIHIFFILVLHGSFMAGNNDKVKPSMKNVSGKIISSNGEEIAGVKITIRETNETFFADLEGNFKFDLKTDKEYSISVESIGYAPLQLTSSKLHLFSEIALKELSE